MDDREELTQATYNLIAEKWATEHNTPDVHALLYGSPLCGFSREMPVYWPERHFFTRVEDIENISCPCCNSIATLYQAYEKFFGYSPI